MLKMTEVINKSGYNKGSANSNWKGGWYIDTEGYKHIWKPDHPYATKHGYVLEHRLIVEVREGRYLRPNEEVHHINGIKNDNRSENLMLFENKVAHDL